MAQSDLRRVQRAARKVNKAREELAQAIMIAQRSGESLRDIAPFAELSYSRVHELIREMRKREGD